MKSPDVEDVAMASPDVAGTSTTGSVEAEERTAADEERRSFQRVVNAFLHYRDHMRDELQRQRAYFGSLPERQQKLVPDFISGLSRIETAVDHNFSVLQLMVADVCAMFQNSDDGYISLDGDAPVDPGDIDKLSSVTKHIVRDWTAYGQHERDACYGPVLRELTSLYPDTENRSSVSVLVPGAGLGRLMWEVARLGFKSQGNEFTYFMLIASNFLLNKCSTPREHTFFPFVASGSNVKRIEDRLEAVQFPDVNPRDLPKNCNFSMAAGDFNDVFTHTDNEFDVVLCVFFIDTARNIIEYVRRIHQILKPGGYFINFGPLLYHFAEMPNEDSIEMTYEDLRDIIKKIGFIYLKEELNCEARYTCNKESMLQFLYKCVFFVCQKPVE